MTKWKRDEWDEANLIKDVFYFFFPSCCIYQYCTNLESDLEGFFDVAHAHHERRSEVNGRLNSLREPVLASPVHSVTFLHISGCDHLCLFSLSFFLFFVFFIYTFCSAGVGYLHCA